VGVSWNATVELAGRYKKDGDGNEEQTGDKYVSACTWLDGGHTNNIVSTALKI
jgi:hypothetical protein